MGVSLIGLTAGGAHAANSDGSIRGAVVSDNQTLAGATITVTNAETGYSRTVTAGADGSFRFSRLPIGTYRVTAAKGGYERTVIEDVKVSIGGTTSLDLQMQVGGEMEEIVISAKEVSGLYLAVAESGLQIDATSIERFPVGRSADAIALLAPGVNEGPSFGGISFGGASVGENNIFINGLNISDVETGVGFSDVPFEMFKEFQVKTGGYSVEYGRTTGGVLNAVLKSGTNEFHGGANVFWEPDDLRGSAKDFYAKDGTATIYRSDDSENNLNGNIYLSGPIIKDKLFFYTLFQPRHNTGSYYSTSGSSLYDYKDNSAFWGGKVDWYIVDGHSLEFFAFSDESKTLTDRYDDGDYIETATSKRGGINWAGTYTGHFGDDFTLKVLYGHNKRNSDDFTNVSSECNRVLDRRGASNVEIGCTSQLRGDHRINSRDALRVDAEYELGNHLIRGGFDYEKRTTYMERASVGPDMTSYEIFATTPGASVNNVSVPDGVDAYVIARQEIRGGTFDAKTSAAYLEDVWSVNDDLTVTLGIRWDRFDSKDAVGDSFIKVDNMWSPRAALSWNLDDEGRSRVYASAGRYYFPIANGLAAREGGGTVDTRYYYAFNGLQENETSAGLTNVTPILGEQLGTVVQFGSGEGRGADIPFIVDQDLQASHQDEFILGYERQLDDLWSVGVRGVYRKFRNAIEDIRVYAKVPGCGEFFNDWFFGNIGQPLTVDMNCEDGTVKTVTVDLGKTNQYGLNGEDIGSPVAKRNYKALEFVVNREWDDVWMARLSYTLSKSSGNYEGGVNSDTGNDIPGWTEIGDEVSYIIGNQGDLANDHRHAIKLWGAYAPTERVTFGGKLTAISGAPINARAYGNPYTSVTRYRENWLCVQNCLDSGNGWTPADRVFEELTRGKYGRLPWQVKLDLSVDYEMEVNGFDVNVGLDVFNVFNTQKALTYDEMIESSLGTENIGFLSADTAAQPRYFRLSAGFKF
ncbi:TonB-dependent receptor [Gimibacter soli]|uniref:TonB-dependent receptor n=1 Tax=Gimibacter soli TaxID=3024400 RepID=A0AAE9XQB8_9PROT|nr:TonB-dependent receptor [Gimibacter soli]WCL55242.1 TonB-dependent receptor [Gimibacter soli]